jgi:SAM-dependent methyltransferase
MNLKEFHAEIERGERFEFGKNWKAFLKKLNKERIEQAENSLKIMLGVNNLVGKTFVDVGSGSGLFSLAAKNLGASVVSFDFDKSSVWCTKELKDRFYKTSDDWKIIHGSILDKKFLVSLGKFDYVCSWGVLHHTGNMWNALNNVINLVKQEGVLFLALYNHQQLASKYWKFVKKTYNKIPLTRPLWIFIHFLYPTLPSVILKYLQSRKIPRGMTMYYDLLDWLGGYPFEVSSPNEIFNFYKTKGFILTQLKTVGGKLGCNEFVFRRIINK